MPFVSRYYFIRSYFFKTTDRQLMNQFLQWMRDFATHWQLKNRWALKEAHETNKKKNLGFAMFANKMTHGGNFVFFLSFCLLVIFFFFLSPFSTSLKYFFFYFQLATHRQGYCKKNIETDVAALKRKPFLVRKTAAKRKGWQWGDAYFV